MLFAPKTNEQQQAELAEKYWEDQACMPKRTAAGEREFAADASDPGANGGPPAT